MKKLVLSLSLAALLAAPAAAANVTLTPLVVAAQNTIPTVVSECTSPDVPARVSGQALFEMPQISAEQGVSGVSAVEIQLDSKGGLVSERIYTSSSNPWLDDAALRSARVTRFSAEMRDCRHVGGTYLYAVEF